MPAADPTLAAAIAAFREGRADEARRLALKSWDEARAARAAAILALLELDAGRVDEAAAWNERACERSPDDPALAIQAARLLALRGRPAEAFDRFAAVLRRVPKAGKPWVDFAKAAIECGRRDEAYALALAATRTDRSLPGCLQALLDLLPDDPVDASPPTALREDVRRPISVVTCSVDDARYAAAESSYRRALADWPHEIVRIGDARSLADGYARGLARAAGEIVVFTHDDVEILPADFGHRLARRLDGCDILGVAGADRVTGPVWSYAGMPHLHGCVIYPEGAGYSVAVYSQVAPRAAGIRVIDGVFLAMPRDVAQAVGWDPVACPGFHGYDIDFTLRAARQGLRLAVATDLGVVHHSYGNFGEAWRAAAARLLERYPECRGERGPNVGSYARHAADARRAMAIVDRWAIAGEA